MSDWQKVRIQFTDANGEEMSAVMYEERFSQYAMPGDYYADQNGNGAMIGAGEHVTVTPIRELPTGLGAVVKVVKPQFNKGRDLYIHTGNGWWCNNEGNDISAHSDHSGFDELEWPYEVLSEGIEL